LPGRHFADAQGTRASAFRTERLHPERAVPVRGPDSRSKLTFRRNVILLRALRASLFAWAEARHHEIGCRFGNVSLLVDLRDRVRLVDLRDGLGPRRVADGKADPVAGVQDVQPRAVLDLEFFGRGAGVRAGGAVRHILDRDSAADPIYSG